MAPSGVIVSTPLMSCGGIGTGGGGGAFWAWSPRVTKDAQRNEARRTRSEEGRLCDGWRAFIVRPHAFILSKILHRHTAGKSARLSGFDLAGEDGLARPLQRLRHVGTGRDLEVVAAQRELEILVLGEAD